MYKRQKYSKLIRIGAIIIAIIFVLGIIMNGLEGMV